MRHSRRNYSYIAVLHLFLLLCSIGGCATTEVTQYDFLEIGKESNIRWPPAPQTARILFLGTIKYPTDIGAKESLLKRAINRIFGEDKNRHVMLRPYGVFADTDRIYVTDPGSGRLYIYDTRQKAYFSIDRWEEEDIVSPIGVAVDENGKIYVSDSILKQILVFNKDGKYLRKIGSLGLFIRPAGIALNDNKIYVVDTHRHQILVLSRDDGKFLFSFGKNGSGKGDFNYPTNIFLRGETIYVTDSMNFRIQMFRKNGDFISAFGKLGDRSGDLSKPKGIAVDSEGHIYVTDAHFDNVQIFNREGNLLLIFGNTGRGKGQMILPAGIFIDNHDRIYVADSYNKRIQIFQYLKNPNAQIQK